MGRPEDRRLRRAISSLAILAVLGVIAALSVLPAAASQAFTDVLDQPCITCHPGGIPPDLNARGQAFAAVADHKTNPRGAWEIAARAYPVPPPTSGGFPSVLVPIVVLVLGVGWAYSMIRRRRSTP